MVQYTVLKEFQNSNGCKNCSVKIRKGEYSEMPSNNLNNLSDVESYISYEVVFHWYNSQREMNGIKGFDTMEKAEKFYQKKINDVEKKIL